MRQFTDMMVPSTRGLLPCSRASFSDDRIFLAPTLQRLTQAVHDCVQYSRAVGRTPNPHKLECTAIRLQALSPALQRLEVPGFDTHTERTTPTLVGIPLLSQLPVSQTVGRLLRKFKRVAARAGAEHRMNPLLRIRAFTMYALSSFNYVSHGAYFPSANLTSVQVVARRHWRRTYLLPKWTPLWFLHSPVQAGGPGCPLLPLHNAVQLMSTMLHAAYCRHPLARAAAHYLLHDGRPLSNTPTLIAALQPHGLQVHNVPDLSLTPCPLRISGSLAALAGMHVIYVAYDAAVRGNRVAGAATYWHPCAGELMVLCFACHVFQPTSKDGEWLARLVSLGQL